MVLMVEGMLFEAHIALSFGRPGFLEVNEFIS